MYYPNYELCKEYQQERLRAVGKAHLIHQLQSDRNKTLGMKVFTKILGCLGDLLVSSGLKLKQAARYEAPSW